MNRLTLGKVALTSIAISAVAAFSSGYSGTAALVAVRAASASALSTSPVSAVSPDLDRPNQTAEPDDPEAPPQQSEPSGTDSSTRPVGAEATGDAMYAVTLVANEFGFQPVQISMAGPGELAVILQNVGLIEHDLLIDGVPGKLLVKPNATETGTFRVPKAGTYQFFCSVYGHLQAGMEGTLIVDSPS
jgi:plastocyanin